MKINLFYRLKTTLDFVKFSHTLFAMPFALAAFFLASDGHLNLKVLILIILCMITARNVAMAFNRLADANFDALNPRTSLRHIPQGQISRSDAWLFILINALFFVFLTFHLNFFVFTLSFPTLCFLCFYSYLKRFTFWTHFYLGAALGLSPMASWIAVKGEIEPNILFLSMAVILWACGFDLLYAIQDYQFDKTHGLKSLVVKWGIPKTLQMSSVFHVLSLGLFFIFGFMMHLKAIYYISIVIIGFILIWEHAILKPTNLSKINQAFFTANGFISFVFFLGVLSTFF